MKGKHNVSTKRVLVAGHICLDITPVFTSPQVDSLGEVLSPGKLVQVGKADIHTGGSVANTGLAMNFFGADVKLAAKVGKDPFGQVVREIIAQHGCKDDLAEDDAVGTSYSVVLAVPGVDRVFLHDPGANDTFCANDITEEMLDGISHFHFGYPPLMRKMYEQDGTELLTLFKNVKKLGITTSLDMSAVDPNAPVGQVNWKKVLQTVLPMVDFFVPSVEEICFMLDRERYEQWSARAKGGDITRFLNVQEDIKPLTDELIQMGAKVALIKCGALGMYYKTNTEEKTSDLCHMLGLIPQEWSDIEGFEESFLQENVVSATGAGDTSIAAFLTSMLSGHSLKRCVQLACATGACCIATYDALSGLESLEDVWNRIEAGWVKRCTQ